MAVLKVANRVPKKPIKKLPTSIEITDTTTVQDVKEQLAKPGGWDPERFGIYDSNKKFLSNRKAVVSQLEVGSEISVKDLGPQLSWSTVFVIEYLGPIIVNLAFPLLLRPYIYRSSSSSPIAPLTASQYLAMAMIVAHFLKREYETLFVHRFSLNTMPVFNIFKNSAHYWVLSGFNLAYWIYAPTTPSPSSSLSTLDILGLALYIYGETSNLLTHLTLAGLRSRGGTERGIPRGYGFNWVTCPNYFFEMLAWTGVLLVTRSWATALFMGFAWGQMHLWAVKKERSLRKEFPDRYRKKRFRIVPFVL